MDEKEVERIIEAALFMSSKPLSVQELAKIVGIAAPGYIAQRLDALAQRYEQTGSAIQIAQEEGRYTMRLKPLYVGFVKEIAKEGEISKHALKTLAYISRNEGIKKSVLAQKLGSTIYKDVAELVQKGFLTQKKEGRTKALFTTDKFKSYFELQK
ncbi:MAG: SMC-Scp complex subunit ScpB [Candidatus Micrarchaeota archaeon]|nr:SMC-Scp complex subunit ScpB [Candidatus Micrarchaeota archaeon]